MASTIPGLDEQYPQPKGFGEIGVATELSGIIEEEEIRQQLTNLDSTDRETRHAAIYRLQPFIGNNALLSDLLLLDGSIDALKRARATEKAWDEANRYDKELGWVKPSSEWNFCDVLVQALEAKSTKDVRGSFMYDPHKVPHGFQFTPVPGNKYDPNDFDFA